MSDHDDLYEKVGQLHGKVDGLSARFESHEKCVYDKFEKLGEKIDENIKVTTSLKTRVATISAGIATVFTLAVTFVWDKLTGK